MPDEERDEKILDAMQKAYDFEFELKERLDSKLTNLAAITATVATLDVGVGFLVLDKISSNNKFYLLLTISLLASVGFLLLSVVRILQTYRPTSYYIMMKDPHKFIDTCKRLTKARLVQKLGVNLANAITYNREVNLKKVKMLKRIFLFMILGSVATFIFVLFMIMALF